MWPNSKILNCIGLVATLSGFVCTKGATQRYYNCNSDCAGGSIHD